MPQSCDSDQIRNAAYDDSGRCGFSLTLAALGIVDRFESYEPDRPFIGWALGTARRVVLTHLRKEYRDRQVEFTDAVEQAADAFQRLEPQAEVMKDAFAHRVGNVRRRSRQALLLRYSEGLELEQIAERFGMTAGNGRQYSCKTSGTSPAIQQ